MLPDFPKIECPFIRKNFKVNIDDVKKYGKKLKVRSNKLYLVINEINPGYEWVFENKNVFACEKLDGTNITVQTQNNRLINIQNRKNIIDPLKISRLNSYITMGILKSIEKGYVEDNFLGSGELIGPKFQGNPYNIDQHLWYPFSKAIKSLKYKSFHEHDRTFNNWSLWFKDYLFSLFSRRNGNKNIMAEGIVIYDLKRKHEGKTYMAKLRRDMFDWYYSDKIRFIS